MRVSINVPAVIRAFPGNKRTVKLCVTVVPVNCDIHAVPRSAAPLAYAVPANGDRPMEVIRSYEGHLYTSLGIGRPDLAGGYDNAPWEPAGFFSWRLWHPIFDALERVSGESMSPQNAKSHICKMLSIDSPTESDRKASIKILREWSTMWRPVDGSEEDIGKWKSIGATALDGLLMIGDELWFRRPHPCYRVSMGKNRPVLSLDSIDFHERLRAAPLSHPGWEVNSLWFESYRSTDHYFALGDADLEPFLKARGGMMPRKPLLTSVRPLEGGVDVLSLELDRAARMLVTDISGEFDERYGGGRSLLNQNGAFFASFFAVMDCLSGSAGAVTPETLEARVCDLMVHAQEDDPRGGKRASKEVVEFCTQVLERFADRPIVASDILGGSLGGL
jgi:hypothetical protein